MRFSYTRGRVSRARVQRAVSVVLVVAIACRRPAHPDVATLPANATPRTPDSAAVVPVAPSTRPSSTTAVATPPAKTPPTVKSEPASPSTSTRPIATTPAEVSRLLGNTPPAMPREFRGVWVASVANIDWPSSRKLTTEQQQEELIALLDRASALHLNAVLLQVRPAADALYASKLEPWSEYLTGVQGKAPDPYWDPLEFAVREAHARNLELHAWFNPYRARHTDAKSPLAATHISRTNPSVIKPYAGYLWMDPGEPLVRERTVRVVLDVVKRYDIDGVHIDDYFYPYPENDRRGKELPFPDDNSWHRYTGNGGSLSRNDWRRSNVDTLVHELYGGIHRIKPWVKFGISPFGIWRPGFPTQVKGFDAYDRLYADARKWLREGWLDYFTPQLYWPTTKVDQAYPVLLNWWAGENVQGRHLWPGNFSSRAGATGGGSFPVSELVEQIRVTRDQPGVTGNVHFSMKSFLLNQASMNDSLTIGPYADRALVPATPWLHVALAPPPVAKLGGKDNPRELVLGTASKIRPWQWLVRVRTDGGWLAVVLPGSKTSWTLPSNVVATLVSVSSLNRVGEENGTVSLTVASDRTPTAPVKRGRGNAF